MKKSKNKYKQPVTQVVVESLQNQLEEHESIVAHLKDLLNEKKGIKKIVKTSEITEVKKKSAAYSIGKTILRFIYFPVLLGLPTFALRYAVTHGYGRILSAVLLFCFLGAMGYFLTESSHDDGGW